MHHCHCFDDSCLNPQSVLTATQKLPRLGRVRPYPLKGKFLMRLQKPSLLCFYSLHSPFPLILVLLSFCFFSLKTETSSGAVLLLQAFCPRQALQVSFLSSLTIPSCPSISPATLPVLLLLGPLPIDCFISFRQGLRRAQAADSIYYQLPLLISSQKKNPYFI